MCLLILFIQVLLLFDMQDTPSKDFQAKIGDFQLRMNLMSEQASDISQFNEGLSIYASNYVEKYYFQQFYNLENIPKQTLTIFFDLRTFFDYIVENHADRNRVQIRPNGIVVSNIIKARGVERRQEVVLNMEKKQLQNNQVDNQSVDNPQMLEKLQAQNEELHEEIQIIKEGMDKMTQKSKELQQKSKIMYDKLVNESQSNHKLIMEQEKNTMILAQNQEVFKEFMKSSKVETRYLTEVINQLKREIAEEKQEKKELREQIKQLRILIKQLNKPINKNFGEKIEITIDKTNPYLNKYLFQDDCIQKIDGDETRFQILGNQVLNKTYRTFYEVRIVNLLNNGLIIGVVSDTRKGQRHSYDQKDCICYDGTGKVFEMGRKWPVPVKLQAGQLIRVLVDLQNSVVRWYISFTEVASALIPDSLRNCRLVPYLQLNEVKDKISLNK